MLVSIIIPIYNTKEEKLRRCLNSIISQDCPDFECLMVDDGSKPDTAFIVDEYASKDKRFFALHKENGGVSSARNRGLEHARGEWICFIDSDDRITTNHLSSLVSKIKNNIDIIFCGYKVLGVDKAETHSYQNQEYIGKVECRKFIEETDLLGHMIPWDRIYRNKSFDNQRKIMFDESLSLSEDRLFCYHYLLNCKGIATVENITYIHDRTDDNSLSYKTYPSSTNWYRYKIFNKASKDLIYSFNLRKDIFKSYQEYLYSELRASLIKENKELKRFFFSILHKLELV